MKKFVLVAALLLLVTVPLSAAEISTAAPATTPLLQQIQGPAPLFKGIKQITPYCSTLQGTSCPSAGATTPCTDVCNNQLSCTCQSGHFWYCQQEC